MSLTPEGLSTVLLVLAVLVAMIIAGAILAILARRQQKTGIAYPPETDHWRRFTCALAGPSAHVQGSRRAREDQPEQLYFGFLAPPASARKVHHDDAITDVGLQVSAVLDATASYLRWAGADPCQVGKKLAEATVPGAAVDTLLSALAGRSHTTDDSAAVCFEISRRTQLIRSQVAAGNLPVAYARTQLDLLGAAAVALFDDWQQYGRAYIEGVQHAGVVTAKRYAAATEWLLAAPASPWFAVPWPGSALA